MVRAVVPWAALALVLVVPFAIAASSPYLAGRSASYVVGGMAGIVALALLLVQPLLALRLLPGLTPPTMRLWHRRTGLALIVAVALHVGGLYLTSPPDALDALLLVSPTPFSVYGVVAMWAVLLAGILAALRYRLPLRYGQWRIAHVTLAVVTAGGTVTHALLIDGTMGAISKLILCACVLLAVSAAALHMLRVKWAPPRG